MTDSQLPPRGWYPDPGKTKAWRWWDGEAWSSELHPYIPLSRTVTREQRAQEVRTGSRLLRLGLLFFFLSAILAATLRIVDINWMASMWHWIRQAYSLAAQGKSSSSLPRPPARAAWSSELSTLVVLPLELVALVFTLTFQYRSATVAKNLGLCTRLTPAVGVVGWFLPLANFVMPLMAWLDLLPQRHPRRLLIWLAWALLGISELLTIGIFAVAGNSAPLAGLLSLLQVFGFLGGLASIRLAITAVLSEHGVGALSAGIPADETGLTL